MYPLSASLVQPGWEPEVRRANPHVLQEPALCVAVLRLDASFIVIGVSPWVKVPVHVVSTTAYLAAPGVQQRLAGRDAV